MRYLKKIDKWIFDGISKIVVNWVRRKKMQQHKVDFFIMLNNWQTVYWAFAILFIVIEGFRHQHKQQAIVAGIFLTILVGVGQAVYHLLLASEKEDYDILFAHRKDPAVYEFVRELTGRMYKNMWGFRRWLLLTDLASLVYFCAQPSIVTPGFVVY